MGNWKAELEYSRAVLYTFGTIFELLKCQEHCSSSVHPFQTTSKRYIGKIKTFVHLSSICFWPQHASKNRRCHDEADDRGVVVVSYLSSHEACFKAQPEGEPLFDHESGLLTSSHSLRWVLGGLLTPDALPVQDSTRIQDPLISRW